MNQKSPQEIVEQFLREQGLSDQDVAQVIKQLEEYEQRVQTDSVFLSIAEGSFDLGELVQELTEETFEPIGSQILVQKERLSEDGAVLGRVVRISAKLNGDPTCTLGANDKVWFTPKNAIVVNSFDNNTLFAVPIDDVVVVVRQEIKDLSDLKIANLGWESGEEHS